MRLEFLLGHEDKDRREKLVFAVTSVTGVTVIWKVAVSQTPFAEGSRLHDSARGRSSRPRPCLPIAPCRPGSDHRHCGAWHAAGLGMIDYEGVPEVEAASIRKKAGKRTTIGGDCCDDEELA